VITGGLKVKKACDIRRKVKKKCGKRMNEKREEK